MQPECASTIQSHRAPPVLKRSPNRTAAATTQTYNSELLAQHTSTRAYGCSSRAMATTSQGFEALQAH